MYTKSLCFVDFGMEKNQCTGKVLVFVNCQSPILDDNLSDHSNIKDRYILAFHLLQYVF